MEDVIEIVNGSATEIPHDEMEESVREDETCMKQRGQDQEPIAAESEAGVVETCVAKEEAKTDVTAGATEEKTEEERDAVTKEAWNEAMRRDLGVRWDYI